MKKIIMVVMAFAMVAMFVPKADAADSAQLGLQVTFAEDQDLKRVLYLKQWIATLEEECKGQYDKAVASGQPDVIKQAIKDLTGSRDLELPPVKDELLQILQRRPDLNEQIASVVEHIAEFSNTLSDYIKHLESLLSVISIELEGPNPWVLDDVKLGEKRANLNSAGVPMHKIHNTGNVSVMVSIGYGIMADVLPRPGLEQGVDTYITVANTTVIPPQNGVKVAIVAPGEAAPLPLTFGAPTALSQPAQNMGAGYDVRAYATDVIKAMPLPDPDKPIRL